MAGPMGIGVTIPGLVNFHMSPLTGVQVRLFEAFAPQPQATQVAAPSQQASSAQFSAAGAAAALTQKLGERFEQFRQENPELPALPLRGLQVRYPAGGGPPQLTVTPAAGPMPNGDAEQMEQLLTAHEQIISQFLKENDALLRQIAMANGGTVNILLGKAAAPAASPLTANAAKLGMTYGPFSLTADAPSATTAPEALTAASK